MWSHLRCILLAAAALTAVGGLPISASQASACPNCKAANETDDLKPQAYMYSILFMMGMPAIIFTGFSLSFWRLTRNARLEQERLAAEDVSRLPVIE